MRDDVARGPGCIFCHAPCEGAIPACHACMNPMTFHTCMDCHGAIPPRRRFWSRGGGMGPQEFALCDACFGRFAVPRCTHPATYVSKFPPIMGRPATMMCRLCRTKWDME